MLYRKTHVYTIGMLLLYTPLLKSCQQPGMNAGEDGRVQTAPPAQTPKAKQGAPVLEKPESPDSGLVMASSSGSSPDSKQAAAASRGIVAKRPSVRKLGGEGTPIVATKRAKKEEVVFPNHRKWFTSFTQAVAQIEQDLENTAAWDVVEEVLAEGAEHNFLERSIVCPNDSNPDTEYEYTPLHYAASRGILSLVKELVVYEKVPVDIQTTGKHNTPLHLAASRGHLDIVQFLVEKGANPNLVDYQENSVVHYAATGNYGEMARDIIHYLVEGGADFKKITDPNISMLDMSIIVGNLPIVEYWEDNYTNSQDPDIDQLTQKALRLAQYRRKNYPRERGIQKEIIKILKRMMEARQAKK